MAGLYARRYRAYVIDRLTDRRGAARSRTHRTEDLHTLTLGESPAEVERSRYPGRSLQRAQHTDVVDERRVVTHGVGRDADRPQERLRSPPNSATSSG